MPAKIISFMDGKIDAKINSLNEALEILDFKVIVIKKSNANYLLLTNRK